jgi:hypothetical protein
MSLSSLAKKSTCRAGADWREIEQRLVNFFRCNGVKIEWDGGEAYIIGVEDAMKRGRRRSHHHQLYIRLSELARALAEARL